MHNGTPDDTLVTFSTALGWVAMIGSGRLLKQLAFGHPTAAAAIAALDPAALVSARPERWNPSLVRKLQAYAAGRPEQFDEIEVDLSGLSPFQRRVVAHCRRIPYGSTTTYGALAAQAGSPRAARAVGNCMAGNRIPLVIPCHRVIQSGGRLGEYSAPGGPATKKRLLAMESAAAARKGRKK
jgi:methylated-DNA-[protein]-cysteine S-methyltransferase